VVVRRGDVKPLVGTPVRVYDEVGEGFVEGSNRGINIFLKDKE
jgi:hypothetical protein